MYPNQILIDLQQGTCLHPVVTLRQLIPVIPSDFNFTLINKVYA
jgi:hypothetical protein